MYAVASLRTTDVYTRTAYSANRYEYVGVLNVGGGICGKEFRSARGDKNAVFEQMQRAAGETTPTMARCIFPQYDHVTHIHQFLCSVNDGWTSASHWSFACRRRRRQQRGNNVHCMRAQTVVIFVPEHPVPVHCAFPRRTTRVQRPSGHCVWTPGEISTCIFYKNR